MRKPEFDQTNWAFAPHNRKSFQQVQALFPTTRMRRGPHPSVAPPEQHQDLSSITYAGLGGESRTLKQMLDATFTDAMLVLKDGVVVTEDYYNGMGPDSLHLLNSVTKSFVGMLTGIIAAEGKVDVSQPITAYLPEFADTAFRNTTLQHALDMTAAVKFGEDYLDRSCEFWAEAAVVGWRPTLPDEPIASSLHEYALSLTESEQLDGEHFHYRTVLTNIIAMVLERVTNERVQDLIEQRIWQKLRPEQDAVIVVDKNQFPYVGAGMNACARDLARFGQMLLDNGVLHGQQIVPAAWIEDTLRGSDQLRTLFAESDYGQSVPGGHYHNQVWCNTDLSTMICIGIHGQTIHVNQDTRVVSVKLSTHPEPAKDTMFAETFLGLNALSAAI